MPVSLISGYTDDITVLKVKEGLAQVDLLHCGDSLLCLSVWWEMVELLTREKTDVNKFYTYQRYSEIALITAVRLSYENITQRPGSPLQY